MIDAPHSPGVCIYAQQCEEMLELEHAKSTASEPPGNVQQVPGRTVARGGCGGSRDGADKF